MTLMQYMRSVTVCRLWVYYICYGHIMYIVCRLLHNVEALGMAIGVVHRLRAYSTYILSPHVTNGGTGLATDAQDMLKVGQLYTLKLTCTYIIMY